MKGSGETLRKFASLVSIFRNGAVLSAPGAAAALSRDEEGVRHQIQELHDAGLLRIAAWQKPAQGNHFRVYEWAEPFGAADAVARQKAPQRSQRGVSA